MAGIPKIAPIIVRQNKIPPKIAKIPNILLPTLETLFLYSGVVNFCPFMDVLLDLVQTFSSTTV